MSVDTDSTRLPVFAVSHGGGPWPWIRDRFMGDWGPLARSLEAIPVEVGTTPRAIVVVSAHWIESSFTVQTSAAPPMFYDYSGFPDFTYRVTYPSPGAPDVAEEVVELLESAGLPTARDPRRGYDHGAFVPLAVAYPDAEVPAFQLSLRAGLDPAEHIAVGRALAPLRDRGVLILCSGVFSFHDLSAFGRSLAPSRAFDGWLTETLVQHIGEERRERLASWASAPSARVAHPLHDHLVPAMVAAGAADQEHAVVQYHESRFMNLCASSSYRFGAPVAATDTDRRPVAASHTVGAGASR